MTKETDKAEKPKTARDVLNEIVKNIEVPKGQYNKFGGYYYRSCEDIYNAVKKLLPDGAGLTLGDEIILIGERYYIKATASLYYKNECITNVAYAREEESKKGMDGSQVTGAASSYARKYALNGLFLIDDVKDSDATNDHGNDKPKSEPQKQKQERPPESEVIMDAGEWQKLVQELKDSITIGDLQATFKKVQSLAGSMSKAQLNLLIKEKDKTKTAILMETGGVQ